MFWLFSVFCEAKSILLLGEGVEIRLGEGRAVGWSRVGHHLTLDQGPFGAAASKRIFSSDESVLLSAVSNPGATGHM